MAENARMQAPSTHPMLPAAPDHAQPQASHWLMGTRGTQSKAIKRLLLTIFTYGVANLFLLTAWYFGLMQPWQVLIQSVYHAIGLLLFYALLRSGRTLALPDPTLSFAQVLFAVSAVVLTYALSEHARGAALQMLCLTLVFDIQRLNARQLRLAASGAVVLLCLTLLVTWLMAPQTVNLRSELINIAVAGVQLPVVAMIARDIRRLRTRQLEQRVELQQALVQLQDLSIHDALTGIFNRQHMQNVLQDEIKRQRRNSRAFCVAILDIDHFKHVNDQHGHAIGDVVLREFAKIANATVGSSNILCRWGGEEFLLVLPESDNAQAMAVLATLREHMTQHDWTQYAPGLAVRFSAGVTQHVLKDPIACTLERADQGLYQAKQQGRNQAIAMGDKA